MSDKDNLASNIALIETAIADGELTAKPSTLAILQDWKAELARIEAEECAWNEWRRDLMDSAGVVSHGTRGDLDSDSYTQWFVIRRGQTGWWPILENLGVAMRETRCHSGDWDCCGRFFSRGAYVKATDSRILVKVSYARDV